MKRIFSGIQPTGGVTLGNYLGAIRNWAALQQEDYECIYCMVDLHAVTMWQDPATLADSTREVGAALIASGIDPKKSIVFNQSQVAAHSQLAWVFNCVARVGWMNRMTQFKDKAGKNRENASLGLYAYPALMAADILIYKATHVPVGEDQRQHLELTRDIAQKFNNDFKVDFFPITEPLIFGAATRVMSLRNGENKMSKSDPSDMSRINLTDTADEIAQKIRKAKTDPEPLPDAGVDPEEGRRERPEAFNLLNIYAALEGSDAADVQTAWAGKSFSEFKSALADLMVAKLEPISTEMRRLMDNKDEIDRILADGSERARALADPIMQDINDIVGFLR